MAVCARPGDPAKMGPVPRVPATLHPHRPFMPSLQRTALTFLHPDRKLLKSSSSKSSVQGDPPGVPGEIQTALSSGAQWALSPQSARSRDLERSTKHGGEGMPAAAAAKGTRLLGQ